MTNLKQGFLALKLVVLCNLAGCASPAALERVTVNFDYVCALAAADVAQPYQASADDLPESLRALSYDDYRAIRFVPSQALWRKDGLPFQLQFFHRGGLFREKVTIREFSPTYEQVIPFDRDSFSYDLTRKVGRLHSSLGYAGFRVHAPLNRPDLHDEVIAFLGSSYFRAIGAQQVFGLSSRGLAIDCGLPDRVEEFPRFTDFWVGKPNAGDSSLVIYALLKGPSVTGAYEFVVRPGKETVVEVRSELTFRRAVSLPGVAPLTSMFWYGENSPRPEGELRLEVHDSDGLLIEDAAGGRTWRPLCNPANPGFVDVPVQRFRRFGLMQRDRRITSYEDLEAHYELRPSAWIEPVGDWGDGAIRLVQLPASSEFGDNIVAFWVPAYRPEVGHPWRLAYRMVWSAGEPHRDGLARVIGTHEGHLPGAAHGRLFWVDFAGEDPSALGKEPVLAEIVASEGGTVRYQSISPYAYIGGWRVAIEAEAAHPGQIITLRCRLKAGSTARSETWIYQWKS